MSTIKAFFYTILISMTPIIELRGAIPIGIANDLNIALCFVAAVIGNMIPVPFIIIFIRKFVCFLKRKSKFLQKIALKIENKARLKAKIIYKYEALGLFILVAIPLPGTGAWTGALVAGMLDMRLKTAFPSILMGVITAGVIMTALSYGIFAL